MISRPGLLMDNLDGVHAGHGGGSPLFDTTIATISCLSRPGECASLQGVPARTIHSRASQPDSDAMVYRRLARLVRSSGTDDRARPGLYPTSQQANRPEYVGGGVCRGCGSSLRSNRL